jgi:hypothetical protein
MLPTTHKNILAIWISLLQDFQQIITESEADLTNIKIHWQEIQNYLQSTIMSIDYHEFPLEKKSVAQVWQTETYRYVRLVNTELLFFYSAQQTTIKNSRLLEIQNKLDKMLQLADHLTDTYKQ